MRRPLLALFTAVALLATAACGDSSEQPSAGQSGGATQPDKVNAGVIAILDVAPIYLGKEKGFFSKRNIDLTLTTAQGGAAIVPAVLSGQYQFGFSNAVSLLLAKSQNAPLKVVCNGNNSTGVADDFAGLYVKPDSPIQSPKDLVGKTVAANTLKNIVDTSVRASVKKDGGDPSQVKFTELPFPEQVGALQAGRVDAIFVVEPFQQAAVAAGMRKIASSYVDAAPNLTVAMYFTSTKLAGENPDLVARFTEAMKESLAYADANSAEVRDIIGTYTKIEEPVREKMVLPKWPTEINTDAVNALADAAVADGLLKEKPDVAGLLP
ncbi:ABC transporter substrate-binding protein [Asanoa iriomotensis]|uniref:ABC transporter substrate-binding protein n=1 Tax=Asanoa iriomotensis TaxID=234613 RepID=A0ABQ4CBI6_9ACTN|nr:ABC transporter substrate-binding protein [Asanoa iriomotensis]GIF60120.1 ABC transporter substrate-binding protein [Asanoa iriomotensis]